MTEHTTRDDTGSDDRIIIFGIDEANRSHASQFATDDAELIERAAAAMAMRTLRIALNEHEALLKALPQGRLFGSGKAFVPFVKEATYEQIVALAKQLGQYVAELPPRPLLPATKDKAKVVVHHPAHWSDIQVGSLVLASEGNSDTDGWFEAKVVAVTADDLFSLEWRDWPDEDGFVRHRQHLALLPANAEV